MVQVSIGDSQEFTEGQLRGLEVNGRSLLVVRVEDKLYAVDGKCSHMGSDLSKGRLEGHLVTCRLHGAQFDVRTGERLRNLAARSINAYTIIEENGKVLIELT